MAILIPAWINGTLTPVEKLEVHKKGLRHKAVSVFVFYDGHVLLQRRALGKYHSPGLWANTCCTHPNWDEAPMDCAHRRLSDELSITGLDLRHVEQLEYRANVGQGMIEHELVDCFVAKCETLPSVSPNPDEVDSVDWIKPSDLKKRIEETPNEFTKWLQIYIKDHFYSLFEI